MKINKNFRAGAAIAILLAFLMNSGAAYAGGDQKLVRSYERYLQSYNEFRAAVEKGGDDQTIRAMAERYKQDLDAYRALLGASKDAGAAGTAPQGAAGAPAAVQACTLSELEAALKDLYSPDAAGRIDPIIARLEKIASSSPDAKDAARAKFEIGNAYVVKKDYAKAIEHFEGILKDPAGANADAARKSIEEVKYYRTKIALKDEAVKLRGEALAKKRNFESAKGFSKIGARAAYCAAVLKYRNSLACYEKFSTGGGRKSFVLVDAVKGLFTKGVSFDPEDPVFKAVIADQDAEWIKRQRPAALLEKSGAVYKLANVRWGFDMAAAGGDRDRAEPKFRAALVDTSKIKEIYFIIKPFPPEWIAAHCLYVFEFADDSAVVSELGERTDGFVLSIEARLKKGQSYSLVQGQFGKFYDVYQLCTKDDYIQSTIMEQKKLLPYRLKLDQAQKEALLANCIDAAVRNRNIEKYNTLENNCTNNLFLLMNTVLPKKQQFSEKLLFGLLYNYAISMPRTADKILKKHGVVAETMPVWPTAEDVARANGGQAPASQAASRAAAEGPDATRMLAAADAAKSSLVAAIGAGALDAARLKGMFYDETTDSMTALTVPGIEPGADGAGAFSIDGDDFNARLGRISSNEELAGYVSGLFDDYRAALEKRAALGGPDITASVEASMERLSDAAAKK